MPLYVSIYTIEGGRNTLAGVISLGQNGLTAEPRPGNEAMINGILKESIQDPKTHQEVNPSINPERWIRCLCFNFRSAYLNASGASLIKPGIIIPGAPAPTPSGPPGPGPPGPSNLSPPQPSLEKNAALSVDRRGVSHRSEGPQGGQFVEHGREDELSSQRRSTEWASATGATRDPGVAGGGQSVSSGSDAASERVEGTSQGPDPSQINTAGQDSGIPTSPQAPSNPSSTAASQNPKFAPIEKINKRIAKYAAHFRANNDTYMADWLDLIQDHINQVGAESALEALGEEKRTDIGNVSYSGTGYFEEGSSSADYIRRYLARAGIHFQAGDDPVAGARTIASYPIPESERHKYKPDDVIPGTTTFTDKLEEAKHLPGLETSEDIDVIAGQNTTNITDDVISKLNAKYGEGGWIIKTYGDEAYAGFGILFPQRVQEIRQSAKDVIWRVSDKLKGYGLQLARDDSGKIVGFTDGKQVLPFNSKQYSVPTLPQGIAPTTAQNHIRRLGALAARAGLDELGPALARTSEDNLRQRFSISFHRDENNKVKGVVDHTGAVRLFGTPEFNKFWSKVDGAAAGEIKRAIKGLDNSASEVGVKYMAQPAFKATGVSDADRAAGYTWETGQEGRVHVVVKNGVAKAIPYASLAGRDQSIPIVFYDEDARAMEKAAEDAINALPESERNSGQVYSPDVMKSDDGWKVVEANAAVEIGQSAWLERNPMVQDAYVSHLLGRDPMHVNFVRNLLRSRMKTTREVPRGRMESAKASVPDWQHL